MNLRGSIERKIKRAKKKPKQILLVPLRIQKHELLILATLNVYSVSISIDTFFFLLFSSYSHQVGKQNGYCHHQLFGGQIGYAGLQMKRLSR